MTTLYQMSVNKKLTKWEILLSGAQATKINEHGNFDTERKVSKTGVNFREDCLNEIRDVLIVKMLRERSFGACSP